MPPSVFFLDTKGKVGVQCLPRIGKELEYTDWRKVTGSSSLEIITKLMPSDFVKAKDISVDAWDRTIDYLEAKWKECLLQSA